MPYALCLNRDFLEYYRRSVWDHSGKHTRSRRYLYCFWVFRSAPLGKFGREIACEPLPLFQRHMYWEVSDVEKRDGGIGAFSVSMVLFSLIACAGYFLQVHDSSMRSLHEYLFLVV